MRQHLLNGLYAFRYPGSYYSMEVRRWDRRYKERAPHRPLPLKTDRRDCLRNDDRHVVRWRGWAVSLSWGGPPGTVRAAFACAG